MVSNSSNKIHQTWPKHTAVSSEAWAKLRDWASVAGRGRLLLSGSVAHARCPGLGVRCTGKHFFFFEVASRQMRDFYTQMIMFEPLSPCLVEINTVMNQ